MMLQLLLLFICFISLIYSQSSTINKACSMGDSTCGNGQICVNNRCECDPNQKRFWAGEKYQCRVCPPTYYRLPNRCYKYYSTPKNQSAARDDCRKDQADLFSWRDNSDEIELITALTIQWNMINLAIFTQSYSWSGGIVHHGRGTKAEYKITWFDSKAPTMLHPDFNDPFVDRYCNNMMMANYEGDPEPTRQKKNGETENCISFVFIPRAMSHGQICMADDYCSTKMNYICELTESTIAGIYQTAPPSVPDTNPNPAVEQPFDFIEPANVDIANQETAGTAEALGTSKDDNQSHTLIYVVGIIVIFVIFGVAAFIIIRKRKKNNENMEEITSRNSTASSYMSNA